MKPLGKIVMINLGVLLAYMVLLFTATALMGRSSDAGITFGLLALAFSAIHALVCLILAIVNFANKKTDQGAGFIISFAVILLIGISACFGGAALIGNGLNFH